jgi:hypothetical protein
LTLKVKLRGPDGAISSEIMAVVPSVQISNDAPAYQMELLLDAGNAASYPGSGSTWYDLSGNNQHGALQGHTYNARGGGSLTAATGKVTGSISASTFNSGGSFAVWFYRTTHTIWASMFSNNSPSSGAAPWLAFWGNESGASGVAGTMLTLNGPGVITLDIGVNLGRWIYVTAVYEGLAVNSRVKLLVYNNGTLLSTSGTLSSALIGTTNYWVGQQILNQVNFVGEIAHVAVYKKALTDAEVAANYNATKARYGL